MPNIELKQVKTQSLNVWFGCSRTFCVSKENGIDLSVKMPVLGKNNKECIIYQPGQIYQKLDFQVIETEDRLAGVLVREIDFPLENSVYEIYQNFLELTKDWNLFRVWHYVPFINKETFGLENYKSFCKGRSLAFEAFYDEKFTIKMPAASATGIEDNKIIIYFIAGKEEVRYLENPEQVSAYYYPTQYGPRSPSFARGTVIITKEGKQVGYLSGTASIKSHQSVTLTDVAEQLHTTMDNMALVFERMGLAFERMSFGNIFPSADSYERTFKVYLKNKEDASYVREVFPKIISATEEDSIIYVQSDICRSELSIEIEAVMSEK